MTAPKKSRGLVGRFALEESHRAENDAASMTNVASVAFRGDDDIQSSIGGSALVGLLASYRATVAEGERLELASGKLAASH